MARGRKLPKGDAKARILASAMENFAKYGYSGVSTREIASGAGVSEITIFRLFPCKRNLYIAVLEAELQKVNLRGDLLAAIAEAADGRMAVLRTFELMAATMLQRSEFPRLLQYCTLDPGDDIEPVLRRHLGQWIEVIARYLEPWVNRGELRCGSAKHLVLSMIAAILGQGSLYQLFCGDGSSADVIFKAYAEVPAFK